MPARVSLSDLQSLAAPATTFDWALFLPRVPGGSYTSRDFTFRCTTTSIPAVGQEDFLVEAHGLSMQFPGRRTWDKKLSATIFETVDGIGRDLIQLWLDYSRNIFDNTGHFRDEFAVQAELNLYAPSGAITRRILLNKFYPLTLGEGTLDQSSAALNYTTTWSYDTTQDKKTA